MTKDDVYKGFIRDFSTLLVEKARASKEAEAASEKGFEIGQLMAYHEVVSLLISQCDVFGFDRKELGLDTINPERDLL